VQDEDITKLFHLEIILLYNV